MSLEELKKELEQQIEEATKIEDAEPEEEVKEEEKNPEDQEENGEKPEDKIEDTAEKKEEELDDAGHRRLRREAAAAKKKAAEEETKRANAEAKLAEREVTQEKSEPELPPEIIEIVRDHRLTRAEKEFQDLEASFRRSNPEYDAIAGEYATALAQSIKIQSPRLSQADVVAKTKETILVKAANFLSQGFDPIEELYHEAKDLGFTGKSLKKEETKTEKEEPKPDMKKVASNRAKSAGMAGSSGKSEGEVTPQAAGSMQTQEWMRLSKSQKAAVFAQLSMRG